MLSGPAGVGKTTAALALAEELGWTLVEMNASDARNEEAIERVAGRASITHTLDGMSAPSAKSHSLILLDEADCLTGRTSERPRPLRTPVALREFLEGRYRGIEALNAAWGLIPGGKTRPFATWEAVPRSPGNAAWARLANARQDLEDWREATRPPAETGDRGGLGAIARLVRATRQPVVLTVNDERELTRYSPVFRTSVARIRFYPLLPAEVTSRLREIAKAEGVSLAEGALEAIVARARGDLRAALNDLEAIAPLSGRPEQLEILGTRDLTSDFARFTEEVLTRPRFYRAVEVRDRLDAPPDDLLPWIEENIPHYAPDAVHRDAAFATLAGAERLLARARRWRTYGLWSYASELLTGGVGLAVRERPVPSPGEAYFPRFLGEMGRSRAVRATRDALAAKLGHRLHLSRARARAVVLPLAEALVAPRRRASRTAAPVARSLVRELGLSAEEVAFLLRTEPDHPAVRALLGGEREQSEPPPTPRSPEDALPAEGSAGDGAGARKRKVQRQLGDFGPS